MPADHLDAIINSHTDTPLPWDALITLGQGARDQLVELPLDAIAAVLDTAHRSIDSLASAEAEDGATNKYSHFGDGTLHDFETIGAIYGPLIQQVTVALNVKLSEALAGGSTAPMYLPTLSAKDRKAIELVHNSVDPVSPISQLQHLANLLHVKTSIVHFWHLVDYIQISRSSFIIREVLEQCAMDLYIISRYNPSLLSIVEIHDMTHANDSFQLLGREYIDYEKRRIGESGIALDSNSVWIDLDGVLAQKLIELFVAAREFMLAPAKMSELNSAASRYRDFMTAPNDPPESFMRDRYEDLASMVPGLEYNNRDAKWPTSLSDVEIVGKLVLIKHIASRKSNDFKRGQWIIDANDNDLVRLLFRVPKNHGFPTTHPSVSYWLHHSSDIDPMSTWLLFDSRTSHRCGFAFYASSPLADIDKGLLAWGEGIASSSHSIDHLDTLLGPSVEGAALAAVATLSGTSMSDVLPEMIAGAYMLALIRAARARARNRSAS